MGATCRLPRQAPLFVTPLHQQTALLQVTGFMGVEGQGIPSAGLDPAETGWFWSPSQVAASPWIPALEAWAWSQGCGTELPDPWPAVRVGLHDSPLEVKLEAWSYSPSSDFVHAGLQNQMPICSKIAWFFFFFFPCNQTTWFNGLPAGGGVTVVRI